METSSDATGSSATISSGLTAMLRAMATRWRCPPEISAGVQPDKREQFVHFGPQPDLIGINTIDNQGLRNDVGNLHARIQGRRRVLEDDLHIALDIFLVLPVGALFRDQKVFEVNLAFRRGINAHNGARHRRLAAAGFPDQPEDFPLSQVERNPVDGVHRQGLVDGEMLLVVSDG